MLITGNSPSAFKKVIAQLNQHFSLKDLGEVNLFLGFEILKSDTGLHLCQASYIRDLLHKVNMSGAKGCPTPMVSNRSTVGALQYATITRPDINYAVNKVSRFMSSPLHTHWRAVKRILRYLSGTIDYGIHIKKTNTRITSFSDSDWAADLDDRRSTSGYCTYLGDNLISWCAKKQYVVARSSTEAEYRSLAHAASEVTWLHSLLKELGIKKEGSTVIWVDNLSAIALASNPVLQARTKHIEIDVHFVRDKVLSKELELRHVPTLDQIVDVLTKPLSRQSFVRLRAKLGVVARSALGLRGCIGGQALDDEKVIAQDDVRGANLEVEKNHGQMATVAHVAEKRSWCDVVKGKG